MPRKKTKTGREFEEYVRQLLTLTGYRVETDVIVRGTQIDAVARRSDELAAITYLVEATDQTRPVPITYVKEKAASLLDGDTAAEIICLMLVSKSGFSAEAKSYASTRPRLILRTVVELEEALLDFTPYRDWYVQNYRSATGMFREANLCQAYVELSARTSDGDIKPLTPIVREWLDQRDNNVLFLLGDYGAGKTSFVRQFAFELLASTAPTLAAPIPVLIPLREYRGGFHIRRLVTDTLVNEYGVRLPSFQAFARFCSLGRILLLLDGFDEMAAKSDESTLADCLAQLVILAQTNTKVIVTCRSNFFRSHYQLFDLLRKFEVEVPVRGARGPRKTLPLGRHGLVVTMEPLSRDQIRQFAAKRFPGGGDSFLADVSRIHDLSDLCKRPVLLDMVITTLPSLGEKGSVVNSAALYERYTNRWALRDEWRVHTPLEVRQGMCDALAWAMLARGEFQITYDDLRGLIATVTADVARDREDLEAFSNDVQTCSFLVRVGEGETYEFAHKSFIEYFTARRLAIALAEGREVPDRAREGSPLPAGSPKLSTVDLQGYLNLDLPPMSGGGMQWYYPDDVRHALVDRVRLVDAHVWIAFAGSGPDGSRSLGSELERRVNDVFRIEEMAGIHRIPFAVSPEIATFALEWLHMNGVTLGEVLKGNETPEGRATLAELLRYGVAPEYLEGGRGALHGALQDRPSTEFAAAAGAALVRAGFVKSADSLRELQELLPSKAFRYALFALAEHGSREEVGFLDELDKTGELGPVESVIACYAGRQVISEEEYSVRLLSKVNQFVDSGDDDELVLSLVEGTSLSDDALLEIVGRFLASEAPAGLKMKAVPLLERLRSPQAARKIRRLWPMAGDANVRESLQRVEARLRNAHEARGAPRTSDTWRSMAAREKLWGSLTR